MGDMVLSDEFDIFHVVYEEMVGMWKVRNFFKIPFFGIQQCQLGTVLPRIYLLRNAGQEFFCGDSEKNCIPKAFLNCSDFIQSLVWAVDFQMIGF
jgi:hypothetical protein